MGEHRDNAQVLFYIDLMYSVACPETGRTRLMIYNIWGQPSPKETLVRAYCASEYGHNRTLIEPEILKAGVQF